MKSRKTALGKRRRANTAPERSAKAGKRGRREKVGRMSALETRVASEPPIQPHPGETLSSLPRKERPWVWYVATSLTVVFLVVFSVYIFRMMTTIEQQNQQLVVSSRAFRELNTRFVELRNELTRKEELLRVISARRVDMAMLNGFGVSPVAFGKIFWDVEKRSAVLQVSNLPVVPEGKEYQLWVLNGKTQASAGLFAVTAGGSSFFRVDNLPVFKGGAPSAFAVTLEQKGGSTHPVGAVYLTGRAQL